MRLSWGLLFGLGLGVVQACSPADGGATPDQTARVRSLIEQANAELDSAFQSGDADRTASLFTEDALWLSNGMVDLPGREAIRTFTRRVFLIDTVEVFALSVNELEVYGPVAYDRGTYLWTSRRSQDTTVRRGRYSAVRRRDADGQWRIHRLLDNTSPVGAHQLFRP